MKEKTPFKNEKEFHEMVKKTKKGTFSGWYIIDKDNNSVEFSGKFNRQFKLNKPVIPVNTEYVTRKEFNEYKNSNMILAGNKVARFSFLNLEQKGGIY